MRSPVRASTLPDCGGRSVMGVPTASMRLLHLLRSGIGTSETCQFALANVRCSGKSGKHLLVASISQFDPEPT
jgi:hypothetical protein